MALVGNPYLPMNEYVPDGEPHVFGDRLYIFGSHDAFNGSTYCVGDYVGWSAPLADLGQWQSVGIIYRRQQDPLNTDGQHALYAPDVQQGPDGRYYLYYVLDTVNVISVAVSDRPNGQYQFYGHVHYADGTLLGRREGDAFQFDPAALVIKDVVWLYTGFCPPAAYATAATQQAHPIIKGPMVTKLAPDMMTVVAASKVLMPYIENSVGTSFNGHEFFEAASIRVVNDRYYLIYSSIHGHELCYATAPTPTGPFSYGGVIISNADIGYQGRQTPLAYYGNNHGSIIDLNGQWAVFYHRQTNGNQFSRQGCAEPITIASDGRIAQVEMTSSGLNLQPLPGQGQYSAGLACNLWSRTGAKLYGLGDRPMSDEPRLTQDFDGTAIVAHLTDHSVVGFKRFMFEALHRVTIKLRGTGIGDLLVLTEPEGVPIAKLPVRPAATWQSVAAETRSLSGVSALYFEYRGTGILDLSNFMLND